MTRAWMLYGPTGYTGNLILREALRRGMKPVLGGRDAEKLTRLAATVDLTTRVLPLDDVDRLAAGLIDIHVVLHCAGPFSATAAAMREACIAAGAHYLDITGEIDVLEAAHASDARAKKAQVLICPGVGFDVVPTDCVAATLKSALPDAIELDLGFSGVDHISAGTLVTSMEAVHRGFARVRENGRIVDIPFGRDTPVADFGAGSEPAFVIPWGDVATAYHTTGIPNIRVLIPRRSPGARSIRTLLPFRHLLTGPLSRRLAHPLVRFVAGGPSPAKRERETARVWGTARSVSGESKTAVLKVGNGYSLTVDTSLMAVDHVLRNTVPIGYCTPSQLLGATCLEELGYVITVR
jgi:short subunit dehydrogenase-like uncharacterized protein